MVASVTTFSALLISTVSALHPRPLWSNTASFARWLVHESDYAVVSAHHASDIGVFGHIASISDGEGYEKSTGVIYTYLASLGSTYADVAADSRVTLTFSEMALAGGNSGGCANSTAMNPPCGRVVLSGHLTRVPASNETEALECLFDRHPEMRSWPAGHGFSPFWLAPENITDVWVIDMYGGAQHPTVEEYFNAPWHGSESEGVLI